MQLHRVPQTLFGFAMIFRADQQLTLSLLLREQLGKNVRADVAG